MRKRFVYFDNEFNLAVESGCTQFVTLAVGFDCRCLRLECLQNKKIDHYIIDQPKMIETLIDLCPEINDREGKGRIIPVKCLFGQENWWDNLLARGFDINKRTFFIAEGLSMYLEESEIDELFLNVKKLCAPGSLILGDYITKGMLKHPMMRQYQECLAKWKCPWTYGGK